MHKYNVIIFSALSHYLKSSSLQYLCNLALWTYIRFLEKGDPGSKSKSSVSTLIGSGAAKGFCLVLEHDARICAFAWVTFSDFRLALWYTLKLPPGWSYLVYIFVHAQFAGRGIGSFLLGSLMAAVRDQGGSHMIAGMDSNWHASIRMHSKLGFRVQRRLSQCKRLNIFPTPPKTV